MQPGEASSGARSETALTEVLTELTSQVARLARVLEHRDTPAETPMSLRWQSEADFLPPRVPRNTSWHQKLIVKKVSLPAATGTSLLIYGLVELIRFIGQSDLRLW